jgi:hypothetical protein
LSFTSAAVTLGHCHTSFFFGFCCGQRSSGSRNKQAFRRRVAQSFDSGTVGEGEEAAANLAKKVLPGRFIQSSVFGPF